MPGTDITGNDLTIKQKAFVDALLDPKSPTYAKKAESYLATYNTTDRAIAQAEASKTLRKPSIQAYYASALEKAGITPERLSQKLSAHLDATKKEYNKQTKEWELMPHYEAQMKAIQESNKLLDAYPKDEKNDTKNLMINLYSTNEKPWDTTDPIQENQ